MTLRKFPWLLHQSIGGAIRNPRRFKTRAVCRRRGIGDLAFGQQPMSRTFDELKAGISQTNNEQVRG